MIKALIRLRGWAGWSAPLLFAIKKRQGFSCKCPYDVEAKASWPPPGYAPGQPVLDISVPIETANSEGLGVSAHMCRLAIAFAARVHEVDEGP